MATPEFILHRVNEITQLRNTTSLDRGVEIDVRSDVNRIGKLLISHDPWNQVADFEEWIDVFCRRGFTGTLIINVKEDGLEEKIFSILDGRAVKNFFILDAAMPTIIKWSINKGRKEFAVRLSQYESLESVQLLKDRVNWLWIDCFQGKPMSFVPGLKEKTNMRLCLVSPELQIPGMIEYEGFEQWANYVDAICTKSPENWKKYLNE